VHSGYGKTTRYITTGFTRLGHRVIVSAYYGLDPGGVINFEGVLVVPSKKGPFGQDSAGKYARMFKTDVQFLNSDWWAFTIFPKVCPFPVLHSPMDHINYPDWLIDLAKMYRHRVSYCKFQQEELRRRGVDSVLIPHGVDTRIYRPLDKEECKAKLNVSGKFVFGTVAANHDKETRKSHLEMMKAMYYFLEENPDIRRDIVWIYHTDPKCPQGVDLSLYCHKLGLDDVIRFMSPELADTLLTEEEMAQLYNAFDVFYLASRREGYGLPILEAMACGVPVIGHNFSSFPELVGSERGWLARSLTKGLNMLTTPLLGDCALVDVYDLAECIKQAVFKEKERQRKARAAASFAKQFEWKRILREKWKPFLEQLEE